MREAFEVSSEQHSHRPRSILVPLRCAAHGPPTDHAGHPVGSEVATGYLPLPGVERIKRRSCRTRESREQLWASSISFAGTGSG